MSGGKKTAVTGYRYYFGIHMGIGRGPIDELHEIRVGDRTAWSGAVSSNQDISIDAYNLFGGEEKEGGVQGTLQVMMGESDQVASSGLQAMLGSVLPGFRRMFTAFYDGLISMNNPYPKTWKFRFGRILKGWDGPVFEPGTAGILISQTGNAAIINVLDLPLSTFSGTQNSGDAQVVVDGSGFGFSPSDFATGAARLGNRLDTAVQSVLLRYDNSYSVANLGLLGMSFELSNFTIDYPSDDYDGPLIFKLKSSRYAFTGSGTGILVEVQYRYYASQFQFVIVLESDDLGGASPIFIPIGNRTSFRYKDEADSDARQVRIFIDDIPVYSLPYASNWGNRFFSYNFHTLSGNPGGDREIEGRIHNLIRVYVKNFKVIAREPLTVVARSMNPAHIIYECLTNREWGRGLSSSKLDLESFRKAANTLYGESFGLCLKWTRTDALESFIQGVLDHIAGVLYQSRVTGLMTLKLIRGDYDLEDLPLLTTESGLLEIRDATVGTSGRSVNTVSVTWHDPFEDEDRTVSVRNPAAILSSGGFVNSTSKTYIGIPTADLALRVAQRDLRVASTNLRKFTLIADRSLDVVHPGDVFAIADPKRGIPKMAVRVGAVKDGTLLDGKVTLEVVQDTFSMPAQGIAANVPSTWVPPNNKPCIDEQRVFEVPYFLLNRGMTPAEFDYVRDDAGYIGLLNSRGSPMNAGVQLAVRDGAPTEDDIPANSNFMC